MNTRLPHHFLLFLLIIVCGAARAQNAPEILWEKTFGGSDADQATHIRNTSDGGFIFLGSSASVDGDLTSNRGGDDVWVVKLDAQGAIEWQRSLGGSDEEEACRVEQTHDGGYILLGTSLSDDGDLTVNSGQRDIWVVKLNASGTLQWQRSLGSNADEAAVSIAQTPDHQYVVLGTVLYGDELSGERNYWAAKLNGQGAIVWQKEYGGSSNDVAHALVVTEDDEYILAGTSFSEDGDLPTTIIGDFVSWLVKVNSSGAILWSKCYDGENGGIISAASPQPNRYTFLATKGPATAPYHWLFTIDKQGAIISDKKHTFPKNHLAEAIIRTADNGYCMTGTAAALDSSGGLIGYNTWLVRFASDGNILWEKKLHDDSATRFGYSTTEAADGGLLVAGMKLVVKDTVGDIAAWLAKLGSSTPSNANEIQRNAIDAVLYPNPASHQVTLHLPQATQATIAVSVQDALGRQVMAAALPSGSSDLSFPVAHLPSGLYTVRLEVQGSFRLFKLFKE